MSPSEIEERKDLINLLLLIGLTLTPHFILKIPTYLNLNVGDIEWLSSYGALFTVLLVADTYTSLSQTQSWLGNRAGSLIQFLNWLVIWAGLIYFIFPELDQNTVSAWLLSVIIVVVLESIFWVFVGVEREIEHLHAYRQLHRWLHINVMNFLKLFATVIDCLFGCIIRFLMVLEGLCVGEPEEYIIPPSLVPPEVEQRFQWLPQNSRASDESTGTIPP